MKSSMKKLLEQSYNGDEVIEYIEELERELDKSDKINDKYRKALDKACKQLSIIFDDTDDVRSTWSDKEWKELCFEDE